MVFVKREDFLIIDVFEDNVLNRDGVKYFTFLYIFGYKLKVKDIISLYSKYSVWNLDHRKSGGERKQSVLLLIDVNVVLPQNSFCIYW